MPLRPINPAPERRPRIRPVCRPKREPRRGGGRRGSGAGGSGWEERIRPPLRVEQQRCSRLLINIFHGDEV